jgi:hypothetical protein
MATALRCRFGIHKWQKKWDNRNHAHIKECDLCGKRTMGGLPFSTFPGGGASNTL